MALKEIAINIKATGTDQTVQGMKKVETAANSMGKNVNSATARAEANWNRTQKTLSDVSTATGRAAGEMNKLEKAAGNMGGSVHNHANKAYMGMSKLEMGIMSATMRVMNLTMAAALIAAPFIAAFAAIKAGISVIDIFEVSVLQIAAQLTQLQGPKDIAKNFQDSAEYARIMAEKMEDIDANSFANNEGLMAMLQTMTMQGVVLDVNNQKQIDSFTSLSNAISMYTQGQDQAIQSRQEMNALLTGEVNQNTRLSKILDTQIKQEGIYKGGLKEVVALGQEHGDTLERLSPYLVGVNAATESINKTWSAASSSIETAVNKITREGFAEVFQDVVPLVSQLATWLKGSSAASDIIHKAWLAGKGVVSAVVDILRGPMWVVLAGVGGLVSKILDGWGLLLSSVLPVLADEFKHLINLLNAMVNMGMGFGLIMLDAVGAIGSAIISVGKAALQALTGDFEGAGKTLQGMFSGVYVERFKENMEVVKGTAIAIKEEFSAMQDPLGRMLDKADQYLAKTKKTRGTATAPAGGKPAVDDSADLAMEAYEKEAEKFREAYRALNNAYDKAALDASENATSILLAELDNRHAQGLVSEQQYLDEKHRMSVAASDKEIATLTKATQRAQEALARAEASDSYLNRPADGADSAVVDRYNNAVMNQVKAEKELVEAKSKVSAATAKAKLVDIDYTGATAANKMKILRDQSSAEIALSQAMGDTFKATMQQIEADKLGRIGLDKKTKSILAMVDALREQFAEYEKLHANDELKDSVAVGKASPWEQETLAAEKSYARQMELEKEKLAAMQKGGDAAAAQIERIQLLEQKHAQWAKKTEEERWKANAGAAADAMGQIGEVLMQGNRDQFEAGKAMMMGQAVISAALAIVQCYAQLGPIGGTIAAVGVGIATLAQISAIEATEYQPRALGGPVVAGGSYLVGEQGPELIRMGSAGTVIPNNALAQAGEAQLKATRENTKAIANLSEGFHEIAGSMKDIVLQATNGGLVTSRIAGQALPAPVKETFFQGFVSYVKNGLETTLFEPLRNTGDFWGTQRATIEQAWNVLTMGFGKSVFGGKSEVTGAGLQLGYDRGAVSASQYTQIKKDGGMFHSDKTRLEYAELDSALNNSLNNIARGIASSINTAGEALGGLSVDLSRVSLAATNIDLRGMSEDQANIAIEAWFNALAVTMAAQLGGPAAQAQLETATRFGETSYEALMRITMALQAVNEAATTTGNQLISTAQDVAIANADLASSLIDSFGGLDKFASAIDKYNKVVNSADDYAAIKVAAAHREIAAALADQSAQIPHTIAEYRALVEATDMTSPLYRSLIGLADSFGTIGDAAQEAQDKILDAARDTLTRTMDITRGLLSKIRDLQTSDSVLSPEDQYKAASDMFTSSAARALAGDQEAAAMIPDLVQRFLDASKSWNASGAAFQADKQIALETMSKLAGATGIPTATEAQLLLDNLDRLGTAITESNMQLAAEIGTAITTGLALAGTNLAYGIAAPLAPLQTMEDLRALLSGDQLSPLTSFSGALGSGTTGTATENLSNIRSNTATMIDALNAILEINGVDPIAGGTQVHTRSQGWAFEGIEAVNSAVSTWQSQLTKWPSMGSPMGPSVTAATSQYDVNGDGYITDEDRRGLSSMLSGNTPLPQYASGGHYPGGSSIMGEDGPEFVDSSPGYVYRADETRALFDMAKRGAVQPDNYELVSEIRKSHQETVDELKQANVELRALVRVQAAANKAMVEELKEISARFHGMEDEARRANSR